MAYYSLVFLPILNADGIIELVNKYFIIICKQISILLKYF